MAQFTHQLIRVELGPPIHSHQNFGGPLLLRRTESNWSLQQTRSSIPPQTQELHGRLPCWRHFVLGLLHRQKEANWLQQLRIRFLLRQIQGILGYQTTCQTPGLLGFPWLVQPTETSWQQKTPAVRYTRRRMEVSLGPQTV